MKMNKVIACLLILVWGVLLGLFWCKMQPKPAPIIVAVWDYSGLAKEFFEERGKEFEKAVEFHGSRETYYIFDGKLFLIRDNEKIDAIESMKKIKERKK